MATGMRPKWLTDLTQPIPTQALGYASQGPMTNQQAQQFQTASGYMPSVTVGGNYGVNLPTQRAPADFDAKQRSKALTSRMLDPHMNADGRYFQGAQVGVGANGRPAWIDQMAPGNVAGMDAKKRAIFERMEQQGKGYFDRRTGRFIGASGGTQTPSPQAMATMGNDAAQRTAGIAGRVPSLRPGILDPNIGGTVGGGPLPQATVPDRFSQYTSINGAQPAPAQSPAAAMLAPTGQAQGAGMDAYRARLAESQKLVTARAQQRGADRRERLAGPDWQEVLAMRNPQWAARMAEINAQQGLAQEGLAFQRENAQMVDRRERDLARIGADAKSAEQRLAAGVGLAGAGVPTDQLPGVLGMLMPGQGQGAVAQPGMAQSPVVAALDPAQQGQRRVHYGVEMTDGMKTRIDAVKDDPQAVAEVLTKEFRFPENQANLVLNRLYGDGTIAPRSVKHPGWWGSWANLWETMGPDGSIRTNSAAPGVMGPVTR